MNLQRVVLFLLSSIVAATYGADITITDTFTNVFRDCARHNYNEDQVWSCLKVKAISNMDSIFRDKLQEWKDKDIRITEYITLTKQNQDDFATSRSDKPKNFIDLIQSFLKSRSLEIKFPTEISPNLEEARGKLKKMGGTLLAGMLMMKGTIAAMALGGLALIAGKALTLSMLSLLLSLVAALKKGGGGGGGHDHRRSGRRADHPDNQTDDASHQLAYGSYYSTSS